MNFENIDNNKRLIQKPNGDCDKEFHGDLKYEKNSRTKSKMY